MITGHVIPSIDSIKYAVSSCATCSPGTPEALTLLLNPPVTTAKPTSEVRNGKRSNGPSSAATKSSRGAVVAKNSTRATSIQDTTSLALKPIERLKLATEVINLSLKALTEAIKANALGRATKTPKSAAEGRGPALKSASLQSSPPSPLQPRSLNRPSSSPNKSPKQSRQRSIESENIVALAACARAALAALRKITSSQENKERLPPLQVETGMSALIAKLLALEMIDLASRELYILCRRLGMGRDGVSLDQDELALKNKNLDTTARSSKATLIDLLHVSQIPDDAMCLSLVTTTQLQILRLLSLKPRPFDGTQLADMLALKSVISPVHLIESSTKLQGKEKGAKQLGSLAQIISDLSRVPQCQNGAGRGLECCSSSCVFRLQTLSLQISWKSWLLFSHKVDVVKQFIAPLKKYLDSFIQGTTISIADVHALAESELNAIYDMVLTSRLLDSSNKQQLDLLRLHLYERLLDNARERESVLKSSTKITNWAHKSLQIADQLNVSKAKRCSLQCRAAMSSLWNPCTDQEESQTVLLSQATELLNGSLDGGSEDLDDLLANVSSLRKSAMTIIVKQSQVISQSSKIPNNLLVLLIHFIPQSLKFLIRYLGKDPGVKGGNARLRFEKRLTLVLKVAPATIGNITSLANMVVNHDMELWQSMDEALQKSAHLAKDICLDQLDEGSQQSKKTAASLHVLISNIYWNRYLALKRQDCNCRVVIEVLEKATSILSSQSVGEQSQGQILAKFERLGSLYETLSDWDTALKRYSQALGFLQFNGDIDEVAGKASDQSVNEILANGHYKTMARILEGRSRAFLRVEEVTSKMCSTIDAQQSTPVAQGFLLETQLSLSIKLMRRQKHLPKAPAVVKHIAKELLDIYDLDDFPLRRLRTLCVLLECSLWTESLRSCASFYDPIPGIFSSLGHDMSLATYESHYRACFSALLALVGDSVDTRLLQSSLDIWEGYISRHNGGTWKTLQKRIGDVEGILTLLDTVEEYLYPLACTSASITVLHLSVSILRSATPMDYPRFLRKVSTLALQLIELGFTHEAGAILLEGRDIVESEMVESRICFEWHRAYASYYVAIGTCHKSLEHVEAAERLLSAAFGSDTVSIAMSPDNLLLLAHLFQISAKIALAMEHREKVLLYARKACSVCSRAWSLLERSQKSSSTSKMPEGNISFSGLSHSENELATTASLVQPASSNSLLSMEFWPYVRPMVDGLLMLCGLLVNDGLFLESQHYLEQAEKIASTVKGSQLEVEVRIFRGNFLVRSGQAELGVELLEPVDSFLQSEQDIHDKQIIVLRAKLAVARALAPSAVTEDTFTEAYQTLLETVSSSPSWVVEADNSTDTLARDLERLSLVESTHQRTDKRKTTKSRSEKPKKVTKTPPLPCGAIKHSIPVQELLGQLLHLVFSARLKKGKIKWASRALEEAAALTRNGRESIMESISKVHLLLDQTMSLLESDPVFNILSESTLASPVVSFTQSTQKDSSNTTTAPSGRQAKKRSKTVVSTKTRVQDDTQSKPDLYLYLSEAVEIVASLSTIAHSRTATAILHHWSDMISKLLALASTVCISLDMPRASSVTLAHTLEVGRSVAMTREQLHIRVEKQLSLDKNPWVIRFGDDHDSEAGPNFDLKGFQKDFIDIIPNSWTVVSLSISDSYDELRICRLKASNTPFVICIPLGKKSIRESEDDSFGYHEAKTELKKIVDLANFSAHDAGDLSRKGAKTAWWEARAGLDSRLKDLLINIENIWLGGFRGAMKHFTARTDLMARFEQTFVRVLEKHLPSRSAKAPKSGRVILDSRVLELFVALGNPCDVQDIDEPILDLLYFVVDILQFNGERNAYDEIDFDPMVIDVQDALSHYHELAKQDGQDHQDGHTILILDKKLHQFPWESLPCLAGQSISRLPSLTSLRDRILTLSHAEGMRTSSLSIDRTNGAYVLNPSGDLKHTQANLETPLSALNDWSATTNQAPTESELAATLATKSLYLYFGHGSGGQFIRSRTIRRLDQCAVALLMGCSSSSLTEVGEFEPYGTPINYLQAGAPAVVGTLWDVTDKDIDRFSLKLLETWGLFESQEAQAGSSKTKRSGSPVKKAPRGKSKQRSRTRERDRQDKAQLGGDKPTTLDRAVAESRDACILRYLNGAAPVVYGIPISLS